MQFTPDEIAQIKNMLRFLVKRKSEESGGHNGFHLNELEPFLQELSEAGEIAKKDTLHSNKYFLTTNT